MNSEEMDILTREFGFVFPYDGNRCTDGKITIVRLPRQGRFIVSGPGKRSRRLATFEQVLGFIVQHG